jgi:hypothetical protein
MSKSFTAIRTGPRWIFRSALVLMTIINAVMVAALTDLSLFRSTPLLYSFILLGIVTGSGLMIRNRFYVPVLRNLRLPGKLLLAPLALLSFTAPAAVIYIYYDLTGRESLLLLSDLFTSFGAAYYLSSMAVVTLPAMCSVLSLTAVKGIAKRKDYESDPWYSTIISSAVLAVILVAAMRLTGLRVSVTVYFLPLAAILMMVLDIAIVADFRYRLAIRLAGPSAQGGKDPVPPDLPARAEGFRSVMQVADQYMELIGGKFEYLQNHAGDTYAAELIAIAARTFDPALIPAMKVIAAGPRFSEKVRQEAAAGVTVVEKYYSDPVRNIDLLRLPGIPERTATARGIMLNRNIPQEQDIIKLLSDPNPDIRRTGLMAAGKYEMTGLRIEVMKALSSPDTAREAYYTLRQFGPEVYGDIIGTAIKQGNSERENSIIMKLLDAMPLTEALPWLSSFVAKGNTGVRLKAACSLCERGWKPQGKNRQRIEETVSETLHTVARLIAMQMEAGKTRSFLLSGALANERRLCTNFLFCLISLLAGNTAAGVIMPRTGTEDPYLAGVSAEAIDAVIEDPLRRPLRALLGNNTDSDRLAELSLYYPVRSFKGRSLSSFLLASEQNITGTWTKACALHRAATEGKGLDREQTVSYLFSNSQILQEESARAIRAINAGWHRETEARLQEPARSRIASVISGTIPQTEMIFEKTRFLSLCFNNIPEDKMILLASGMSYTESYDASALPGVISWIVPSENGKTGLYSLAVRDIAAFVFYYSEFTDIFVNYMDNQGGLTIA